MTNDPEYLGGRTALLDPGALIAPQRTVYNTVNTKMVFWAEKAGFKAKLSNGRLIGPFNTVLLSPEMREAFLNLQAVEGSNTTLAQRVRQVVILTVGAVFQCDYERYAHAAVAREAGLSDADVAALMQGTPAEGLTYEGEVARRFTATLVTEHRVNDALFAEARQVFSDRGLVDLLILAGSYQLISSLLNAFEVPVPA